MPELLPISDNLPIEEVDPVRDNLFVFQNATSQLNQIIGSWDVDFRESEVRRDERYVKINVEELRERGAIAKDQTFIPDRVIDGNIILETADIMQFINAGYRLGIFECLSDPSMDDNLTRRLEREVTQGLTYNGWYDEFQKVVDGAALHGLDYIEVMFDETKPLHVSFEHVGFDRLCFNKKVASIQDSEWLIRRYEIPIFRLEQDFVTKYGFDRSQVDVITKDYQELRRNDIVIIFKGYFKYNGMVYVCWFSRNKCTDWLKPPQELKMGIYHDEPQVDMMGNPVSGPDGKPLTNRVESPVLQYPIFTNLYRNDEQEILIRHEGRAFLDGPQQEANTAIITGFVNKLTRSNNIYGSPKIDDGDSAEMKILDMELEPDAIYNKPMDFFTTPPPDPQTLNAVQFLDSKNAQQSGRVAFAANNRKDSRKTATELDQSAEQQSKITSTGIAGFSSFLRNILDFSWLIIQSQAIDGKIKLLLVKNESVENDIPTTSWSNDVYTISQEWDIRPAGNTDIIEAQMERQKMQQDWPVVQTFSGLREVFFEQYLKVTYPKEANMFIAAMRAGNPGKALVKSLGSALLGFIEHPDEAMKMKPEDIAGLQQLEKQAQQYLSMP